jgi:hypothetical protein
VPRTDRPCLRAIQNHGVIGIVSTGHLVASILSDQGLQVDAELGLEIINSEIVAPQVAGAMGIAASAVQRNLDGKATLFDRWPIDTRKLSQYTLDQILNLALKDNVLIRGWGAAALFQGIRDVICVRVCAPMASRVAVMMERLCAKDADAVREEIDT